MFKRSCFLILLLAVCSLSFAKGKQAYHQKIEITESVRFLEISIVSGDLKLSGTANHEIKMDGFLGEDVEKLEIKTTPTTVYVEVKLPKSGWNIDGDVELAIELPAYLNLKITTVSASIALKDVASNEIYLKSVSGDLSGSFIAKEITLQSVSGDIETDHRLSAITSTFRGQKELDATKSGGMAVHTEVLDIETVSGEITFSLDPVREMNIKSVSGDITGSIEGAERVKANTTSGDIELHFKGLSSPRIDLNSVSGDVYLELIGKLDIRLQAKTFSGSVSNQITHDEALESEHGPGSKLRLELGSAKGDVNINTFSGDIQLH